MKQAQSGKLYSDVRKIPLRNKATSRQIRQCHSPGMMFDEIELQTNIPMTSLETETAKSKLDLEQKHGSSPQNLNSNQIPKLKENKNSSRFIVPIFQANKYKEEEERREDSLYQNDGQRTNHFNLDINDDTLQTRHR